MRIWLIQIGEPIPLKIGVRRQRLTLIADALAGRGHEVVRWGSAFDHITKSMLADRDTFIEPVPNFTLRLIRGLGYERNVSVRRYLDHRIISRKFLREAATLARPDLVLVATPPHDVAAAAVRFACRRGVPVVVDIRDQWPDIFLELLPPAVRRLGRVLLAWDFQLTKYALRNATALTAMMSDLLEWGLTVAGRPRSARDRLFYIGTDRGEDVTAEKARPEIREVLARLDGKFVVTFVGTFNRFYDPSIIVDAARIIADRGVRQIVFVLAGTGGLHDKVEKAARGLPNVIFTGWLRHEEIMLLLARSQAGVCPLSQDRPCFPNKVFIYLSRSVPVLSCLSGDFKALIDQYEVGVHYQRGDATALAEAVLALLRDPQRTMRIRANIDRVFDDLFSAARIYQEFSRHLEMIASECGPHGATTHVGGGNEYRDR